MPGPEAIAAISVIDPQVASNVQNASPATASVAAEADMSFARLMSEGAASVSSKVDAANAMVRSFALDDSIPVHQVTMAIEEARLAVELAMQVRSRLVEGYREIMNMQL